MVIQFANNNSIKFQNDAINYLIENLGDNHQIIVNELNKLLLLKTKVVNWKIMFISIIIGFILLLYLSYGMLVQDVSSLSKEY